MPQSPKCWRRAFARASSLLCAAIAVLVAGTPLRAATLPAGCAPADGSAAAQQTFTSEPPMCLQEGTAYTATIETTQGTLHGRDGAHANPPTGSQRSISSRVRAGHANPVGTGWPPPSVGRPPDVEVSAR